MERLLYFMTAAPKASLDTLGLFHSLSNGMRDHKPLSSMELTRYETFCLGGVCVSSLFLSKCLDVKDGAKDARLTSYAQAQHFRAGEGMDTSSPNLMSGSIYSIELVHDEQDGLWKVVKWAMKIIWSQGDMSIVTGG